MQVSADDYDFVYKLTDVVSAKLFTHSPDAANPWDYFPLAKWSQKTHGAVLFGALHDLYTIR